MIGCVILINEIKIWKGYISILLIINLDKKRKYVTITLKSTWKVFFLRWHFFMISMTVLSSNICSIIRWCLPEMKYILKQDVMSLPPYCSGGTLLRSQEKKYWINPKWRPRNFLLLRLRVPNLPIEHFHQCYQSGYLWLSIVFWFIEINLEVMKYMNFLQSWWSTNYCLVLHKPSVFVYVSLEICLE